MTTFANGLLFDNAGKLLCTNLAPSATSTTNSGLIFDALGNLHVSLATPAAGDPYLNGLRLANTGELYVTTTAPTTARDSGLFVVNDSGQAYISEFGTENARRNAIGFTSGGAAIVSGPLAMLNDFSQGSLTSQVGPAWTVTRASATTSIDSSDLVVNIASGAPRWHRIGAASGISGLAVWGAHTNLCLQSENFGTTWAAVGTPTRSAASDTCGVVALDLIGDDDASALEGYTQTVTFTGNAVKAVSVYVKKGTSTSSVVRLRDTTAPADRLLAAITWTGSVPTVTMTTGTLEGTDALGNGVYRVRVLTTSVTAANTNSLQFYPATNAALATGSTGDILIGGVMAQNALSVYPYIKTTTATVTVNADVVTASGTVISATVGTLYVKAPAPQDAAGGNHVLFEVDDGTSSKIIALQSITNTARIFVDDPGVIGDVSVSGFTAGVVGKVAGRYKLNDINLAFNGTAGTADTSSTVPAATTFRLGFTSAGFEPNTVIQEVRYYNFAKTDAELQALTT